MDVFKAILGEMKSAVIIHSASGEPEFYNRAAEDIFPDIVDNGYATVESILSKCREVFSISNDGASALPPDGDYVITMLSGGFEYVLRVKTILIKSSDFSGADSYALIIDDISEYDSIKKDLEDSMNRFDEVAENAQVFIWEVDIDGLYVYANPIVESVLGYSQSDVVGKKYFYDFFEPSTKKSLKAAAFKTFQRKEPFSNFVNVNIKKDGAKVWLKTSGVPVLDKLGNLMGYRGSDIDVTENIMFEEALIKSHERYRLLFEGAAEGIVMVNLDAMSIEHCNESFCKMFDYQYADILKKRIHDFHPKNAYENLIDKYSLLGEEKKKFIQDIPCLKSDGTIFISNISVFLVKIADKDFFVCFFTDITDVKFLRDELSKLGTAVEQSANMIAVTDAAGNIQMVNSAFTRCTGYSKNEIIGMNMSILKSGHQSGFFYENMWNRINAGDTWTGRILNKKKNGTLYWDRTVITPIKNDHGDITNFISVKEDITEMIQAEAEKESLLKEMDLKNRELETLSYGISHDMKSPLVTIEGYVTHLEEDFEKIVDDDARKKLATIKRASSKLRSLIDEFMKYSKLGRLPLNKEKLVLGEVVSEALMSMSAAEKHPEIKISIFNESTPLRGDKNRVFQIFENLIYNSIKYIGENNENPTIEIGADDSIGEVVYYVKDNGIGIEKENIDKLFNMFFQASKAVDSEGSGVGLSIVKKIIELHGGKIWVESEPGKGTTVHFTL